MAIQFKLGTGAYAAGNFTISYDEMDGSTAIFMNNSGGGTNYTWSFISQPKGSSCSLNNAGTSEANFIPDMVGTYIINLDLNGTPEQRYAAVLTEKYGQRLPGRLETDEDATYGWSGDLNDFLEDLDAKSFLPVVMKVENSSGAAISQWQAASVATGAWSSYSDGIMPVYPYGSTYATSHNEYRRPLGINIGSSISSGGGNGEIVTKGVINYPGHGKTVGEMVFLDDSTGLLIVDGYDSLFPCGFAIDSSHIYVDFTGEMHKADTFIPIEWCEDGAVPPAISEVLTSGNGSVRVRRFSGTVDEDVTFSFEVPKYHVNLSTSDAFTIDVIGYISESTTPGTSKISIKTKSFSIDNNQALGGSWGSVREEVFTFASHAQYDRFIVEDARVYCYGDLAGETAFINVQRAATDTDDTYGQDIAIAGFRIKWFERR